MKSIWVMVAVVVAFALPSCKEVGPDINLGTNQNIIGDTTYVESPVATAEEKNVIIEEFTGVRCPNCPQGHQIIASLKNQYPAGRVVSVSLHPINSLGLPYHFSAMDFRSDVAQDLFSNYFGQVGFEPAASIDRRQFSGESYLLLDKNKWSGYVAQQMALTTPVNVLLNSTFDSVANEATIVAELHYTQTVPDPNRLTVLLVESGMITAQLNGSLIDTFYVHKDIMRTYITDPKGDAIDTTLEAGRVIRRVYKKVLDAAWKPENVSVVALVHQYQNAKVVYQAKEMHLK